MTTNILSNNSELFFIKEGNCLFESEWFDKTENGAILFCLEGEINILIDLKPLLISKNTQVIIMPNSIVKIQKVSPDLKIFFLGISSSLFRAMCAHVSPTLFRLIKQNPLFLLSQENKVVVESFMQMTRTIYNDIDNQYRTQIIKSTLNAFILYNYDKYQKLHSNDENAMEPTRNKIFDDFIDLIHKNCLTEREVTFYADKLCISCKYLSDICHNIVGASAKKIIDNFSLLEMKVLLHNTQLSMQDIANKMGFPDQSYMGRYFKRYEGISPSAFRKQVVNEMGG
ncbi:MAG: AraC family transcriptional regulator [Bacteroidales bacterium]|nr:AraC family transcriptional regulator [Bacteroidales bacterium]